MHHAENHHVATDPNIYPPSNGVITSDLAAALIEPVSGQIRGYIYDYIISRGALGATSQEVEIALGIVAQTVTPRVLELRKMGMVCPSGEFRPTRSGRKAQVWVACPPEHSPKPQDSL
ncbi:hypothetical protein [Tautonia sociabilis]|uniref:Uncharacterized protein n=1 Tax=Tautonia sociabilis TaxID=2080755 RepID=A0A432ML89_9BACT|nr:hypothetical protein [Tautonia sociabilis]RUL88171.1 hypothetical protein TsocGM_08525 [Tautonia sociabilis]